MYVAGLVIFIMMNHCSGKQSICHAMILHAFFFFFNAVFINDALMMMSMYLILIKVIIIMC